MHMSATMWLVISACFIYGCQCSVCGVVLSGIYGEIAQGFIHVHHLRQLAEVNAEYEVDPIVDLRPVCPTCHSIIHRKTPPYSIEEVQESIKSQRERLSHLQEGGRGHRSVDRPSGVP